MHRYSRIAAAALLLVCAGAFAFAQEDERAQYKDFNWFEVLKMEPASAFSALWDQAARHKASGYDQKEILSLLLQQYAAAKQLEKTFPYDPAVDAKATAYTLTYDRTYSDRLALPWTNLLKLNVRSAMQYILLEILYTKGVPKSKGKVPTSWSLFSEYFGYYVTMKTAS